MAGPIEHITVTRQYAAYNTERNDHDHSYPTKANGRRQVIYLDDLVAATNGRLLVAGARSSFPAFAHDSRQVMPGACFVAVRGPHRDGHVFVAEAIARGAGAALVERRQVAQWDAANPDWISPLTDAGASVIAVDDTREALRHYAEHILDAWKPLVVAVTGSTGKTTTKEAIADVLGLAGPTFRSWRNYNDLLGLPLSLGQLEARHAYAVLEMGSDRPGEIGTLCALTRPTVGVVTNVSATQLQDFGNLDQLANEFASLPQALPDRGFAVLNADDPATRALANLTQATVRLFGPLAADDLAPHPPDPRITERYQLRPLAATPRREALALIAHNADEGKGEYVFPHLHADHWAYAVLAALTVGAALGVDPTAGLAALRDFHPLPGRLNRLEGREATILLDDSHNAAPASVRAGLAALAALGEHQTRIAVLGDMLRLGGEEAKAHRDTGRQVASDATHLVTLGTRAELIAAGARRAGMRRDRIAVTHTPEDAASAALAFARDTRLTGVATPGAPKTNVAPVGSVHASTVIVIKGSEEMRMERVTAQLMAHPDRARDALDRQTPGWQHVVVMRPDRPTWLEIDLGAIGRNTRLISDLVGEDVAVLASLKADAYGHGALPVAHTVLRNGARWLGVATVSEARPLREAGIAAPILVFGFIPPWQARETARLDLRATIYSLDLAHALARAARDLGRTLRIHVKIDTGMGRLGLRAEDIEGIVAFFEDLGTLEGLAVEGIYTHLATADSADQSYALRQLDRFERVLRALGPRGLRPPLVHAANSAATLALPQTRYNLVRPGIALYGLSPSAEVRLTSDYRPALTFKTQVAQVKEVPTGEGISYGASFVTTRPTRVATLPVGYADGFRRAPANWGEVLIHGRRAPLLGRVCMDQCMIDVSTIPDVRLGDEVVLIGRQGEDELSAEAVAARLGTIHYEVIAELLARVPRVS